MKNSVPLLYIQSQISMRWKNKTCVVWGERVKDRESRKTFGKVY